MMGEIEELHGLLSKNWLTKKRGGVGMRRGAPPAPEGEGSGRQ